MNENELLRAVCAHNKRLAELGLVILTEGNVSERHGNLMAIKPSGVSYREMMPMQMVILDIKTGAVVQGGQRIDWKPSVDTPIHLEIYRRFPEIGGIAHTHSPYATIFAQNAQPIPCMGTTHADAFHGTIPVTRSLTEGEMKQDIEKHTGIVITNCFSLEVPAVLVRHHGPFTFGKNAEEAVNNALILEKVAFLAWHTILSFRNVMPVGLQKAHYARKHGESASYGQP